MIVREFHPRPMQHHRQCHPPLVQWGRMDALLLQCKEHCNLTKAHPGGDSTSCHEVPTRPGAPGSPPENTGEGTPRLRSSCLTSPRLSSARLASPCLPSVRFASPRLEPPHMYIYIYIYITQYLARCAAIASASNRITAAKAAADARAATAAKSHS